MSHVGKIARLQQYLREQLNRRIEDGEPGRDLVDWLNPMARCRTRSPRILRGARSLSKT
jgi:hypothetical protein